MDRLNETGKEAQVTFITQYFSKFYVYMAKKLECQKRHKITLQAAEMRFWRGVVGFRLSVEITNGTRRQNFKNIGSYRNRTDMRYLLTGSYRNRTDMRYLLTGS